MSDRVTDEGLKSLINDELDLSIPEVNESIRFALKELLSLRSQDNQRFWKSEIQDLREKLEIATEALIKITNIAEDKFGHLSSNTCWDIVYEALRRIGVGE